MSGISKKIPSGPTIVKPRLITVGRGKALPRVESQPRPGPAHHVGAVAQSSSGLRRPKLVRQEPSAPESSSISMKEKKMMVVADIDRNGVGSCRSCDENGRNHSRSTFVHRKNAEL